MVNMSHISIIILNWNGMHFLNKCLTSIMVYTDYSDYEVIVVDNGSVDGSIRLVEENYPNVKLIKNCENLGFSKGNNIGVRNSKGDYILILNNDTEMVDKNWLNNAVKLFESDEKIGVIGCKLLYPDGKLQHAGGKINFLNPLFSNHISIGKNPNKADYNKFSEVDYVTAAAIFVKKEVIKKIGVFDEIFSPIYYEDSDFCIRARRAGYKVIYAPNIKIIHHESVAKKQHKSEFMNYISTRNKILFCLLNMPLKYFPIRAIYEFFSMSKWVLMGQGKSYFKAVFWNIKNLNLIIKKRNERKRQYDQNENKKFVKIHTSRKNNKVDVNYKTS